MTHQDLGVKLIEADKMINAIESVVNARIKALTSGDSFSVIRSDYRATISDQMTQYLATDARSTSYRNAFKRAVDESFTAAFARGYAESGGDLNDIDTDAYEDSTNSIETEQTHVDELFVSLKALRDSFVHGEVDAQDMRDQVASRTDGYSQTLEMIYARGKLWGAQSRMLTMVGDDGKESCRDCQRNKGKRYSAKKWLRIGFPPSRDYECHGYFCQHYLQDDSGNPVTL